MSSYCARCGTPLPIDSSADSCWQHGGPASQWCSSPPCTPKFYSTTFEQRWGSLKVYPASDVQILFGNQWYTLLEFHFHAPAEHLVNAKLTEMEVHVVFAKNGGSVDRSIFLATPPRPPGRWT